MGNQKHSSVMSETAKHMDRLVANKCRKNDPLTQDEVQFLAKVAPLIYNADRLIGHLSKLQTEEL